MGICLSCLRGRDSNKDPVRRRTDESQPLLDDSNDMYGGQYGTSEEQADQIAQRRQQELSQIVQTTHDYFIDVSSIGHPENPESQADVSALRELIEQKASSYSLNLPKLRDVTPEEHNLLQESVADIEAQFHESLAPTRSNQSKS